VGRKTSDCNYCWNKSLPLDINVDILLVWGKPDLHVEIQRLGADKFFNANGAKYYTIISTVIIDNTSD
jgi:hypothetical protein